MSNRVQCGKGDRDRTLNYRRLSEKMDAIRWNTPQELKNKRGTYVFCKKCQELYEVREGCACEPEVSKKSKKFDINVMWFNAYTSEDINGRPEKITSHREENRILEQNNCIRGEDFDKTFKESQQQKNIRDMRENPVDMTGINIGFKGEGDN